jgi:L-rhamnose mutarotase
MSRLVHLAAIWLALAPPIFLDEETGTLFAVNKVAAINTTAELRKTELMQKWWAHMADLMEVNPDNSPVRTPLKQVFHQA